MALVSKQPESELEARVNKATTHLQNQVNTLSGQLRKTQAQLTHPAALTRLNNMISSLSSRLDSLYYTANLTKNYYVPDSFAVAAGGTVTGDVSGVVLPFDVDLLSSPIVLIVNEVAGVPGFDVQFSFINVISFNKITLHFNYNGTLNHRIKVQLYNYTTPAWEDVTTFSDMGGYYQWIVSEFPPVADFVDPSGNAKLRFYHITSGNATHTITFDYVALIQDADL